MKSNPIGQELKNIGDLSIFTFSKILRDLTKFSPQNFPRTNFFNIFCPVSQVKKEKVKIFWPLLLSKI